MGDTSHKFIEPLLNDVTDRSIAVDGGAYMGVWSSAFASRFGRVISFELCPYAYRGLIKNLGGFIASGNVVPLNIALGQHEKEVFFTGSMKADSPIKRVYPAGDGEESFPQPPISPPVQMLPLDSFDLPSLGLLKLDLQGYDYFALLGAEKTIKKFRPPVYVEIDAACQRVFGVFGKAQEFLTSLGYKEARQCGDEALWLPCTAS